MDTAFFKTYINTKQRIFWHILFWVAFWLFYSLLYGSYTDKYGQAFISELVAMPVFIIATYFTLYFLLPKYLLKKHYAAFFIGLASSAFLFGFIQRMNAHFIIYPMIMEKPLPYELIYFPAIIKNIITTYTAVFLATSIKLLKISYQREQTQQQLIKEKLEAELKFLKSQIHPHFLFNTLNNLYALTLKGSKKAPEMVLKLSSLLDYMLYESNVPKVPLGREIALINNYISLEKLRHGDKLQVEFDFTVDSLECKISPLLLLPFIENSFKHGTSKTNKAAKVKIDLNIEGKWLTMKVCNQKQDALHFAKNYQSISLDNVQRRLKLLYPNQHKLTIENGKEEYKVILRIQLDFNQQNNFVNSPNIEPIIASL